MKLPKIIFRKMTLEENIEIIKWAYYEKDDLLNIHEYALNYFPELKNIDNLKDKDKIISDIVKKEYVKHENDIKKDIERYKNIWNQYNDIYFLNLSNYLNINLNIDIIEANVGLIPIFPRYLDTFSFSVSTNITNDKIIEICAHETLHFLWFLKWKIMYPDSKREDYESPNIIWKYSEMVVDPILNSSPFNNIFPFKEKAYDVFYEIYDKEKLVMDNLINIYKENISIENKIKKGFEYIEKINNETKKV